MNDKELMEQLLRLIEEYLSQDQKVTDSNIVEHIMKILVQKYDL